MLQSDQTRGDLESRERAIQREVSELQAQLAEMNQEKQLQKESVQQAERSNKILRLELEEKNHTIRKLQDEVSFCFATFLITSCLSVHFSYIAKSQAAKEWRKHWMIYVKRRLFSVRVTANY